MDQSCSYFYFLWGTQAEIHRHYNEALEAYEKSLICDPSSEYIQARLPILYLKMGKIEKAISWLEEKITAEPKRTEYVLLLADLYVRQEHVAKAITLYRGLLDQGIHDENISLRLGLLFSHQNDFDKAEKIFRTIIKENSDSYFAHLALARLFIQTDRGQQAEGEYEKALALNWSRELAFELGQHYLDREKFKESLRIFTGVSRSDPLDERAALSQVQSLLGLKRDDQALELLDNIATYTENRERIDIIRSKILLQQERRDEARAILISLVKHNHSSQALYMLALLAYQDKAYFSALDYLKNIKLTDSEFEEAVFLRIRIYGLQKRYKESFKVLTQLTKDVEHRIPLYFMLLASLHQQQQQFPAALETLENALVIFPDNPQLHFEYGMVLERQGREEQAMHTMEKVLTLEPDHPEALNYIGYTWADQSINLSKALSYIEKADKLKPNNPYIIDSLGWVYFRLGRLQEAVEALERSLQLMPEDPQIFDHLGDVYRALGKNDKAIRMYQKSYDGFNSEESKRRVQEKVDQLVQKQKTK